MWMKTGTRATAAWPHSGHCTQSCKQFCTMLCRAHILKHLNNVYILTDQKSSPQNTFIFLTHEFFRPPNSIQIADLMAFICQQWELKLKFLFKFDMRRDRKSVV